MQEIDQVSRRGFLQTAAASAAAAQPMKLLKPKALKQGDTIGLITPATFVSDPDDLAAADRTIRYFGWKPKLGANVKKRAGYLGGSRAERLHDLHAMFADPEVRGIFCIRGGYGSGQLLDGIDYDLIRQHPKVFLGYSDITSLHLAIHQKTGLVTFHGPVSLSRFTEYTQRHFRKAVLETAPLGVLRNPEEANLLRPAHTWRTIRGGRARGRLTGGNLSLIAASMGTPFEIDARGKILFIEDVGEQPYSVDRMLTQLRLSGKLQNAAGIVFGECNECVPREFRPSFSSTFSLGEVLDNILGDLPIPVLTGLTIGHTADQLTLPLGLAAVLNADRGELTVEEAGVV